MRIATAAIVMMLGTAAEASAQEPAVPAAPAAEAAAGSDAGSGSGRYDRRMELPSTQAYFDDASKLPIAPIIVQPDPPRRRRPTLWIGGLLVLAALFLWSRNRRLDIERAEAAEDRRAQRSPRAPAGEDAVDLAAAAQADADDEPDGVDDPPEYNAAPSVTGAPGAPASPAPSDSTEEPR